MFHSWPSIVKKKKCQSLKEPIYFTITRIKETFVSSTIIVEKQKEEGAISVGHSFLGIIWNDWHLAGFKKNRGDLDPCRDTSKYLERRKIGLPTLNSRPFFATHLPSSSPGEGGRAICPSFSHFSRGGAMQGLVRRTESKAEHRVYVGR